MGIRQMNMLTHMDKAWNEKRRLDVNTYQEHCKNLISHAYMELVKMYKDFCRNKGQVYKDEVFYMFQRIFVFIMKCDGEFLQGEYDAYVNFCRYAGIQALSVNDIKNLYARKSTNDLSESISYINSFRSYIDDSKFEALVLAFCYLSLLGDKSFDENEYYIIRCFFDRNYDYYPKDWATFKNEW